MTYFFHRITKFIDGSKKHITRNAMTTEETKQFAKQQAQNILAAMKELGYPLPCDDDSEDPEDEEGEEEEEEEEEGEEEEEEIHMYSDEGEGGHA